MRTEKTATQNTMRSSQSSGEPLEHAEHVTFYNEFKKLWPDILIHSIPNGGKRHPKVAKEMKAEGLTPGIPDLFIPEWALWVEMKRVKSGSLSPDQKKIIPKLKEAGYAVIVAKGWIDGINQVHEYHSKMQLDKASTVGLIYK